MINGSRLFFLAIPTRHMEWTRPASCPSCACDTSAALSEPASLLKVSFFATPSVAAARGRDHGPPPLPLPPSSEEGEGLVSHYSIWLTRAAYLLWGGGSEGRQLAVLYCL